LIRKLQYFFSISIVEPHSFTSVVYVGNIIHKLYIYIYIFLLNAFKLNLICLTVKRFC